MEPTKHVVAGNDFGTPFGQMTQKQKVSWLLRALACLLTFGMAFPNVFISD